MTQAVIYSMRIKHSRSTAARSNEVCSRECSVVGSVEEQVAFK